MAKDLGFDYKIQLATDATAALGMTKRLGIGRVRHLDTSLLWMHSKARDGDIDVAKVDGQDNCADIMTKYVARPMLQTTSPEHVACD